MDVDITLAYTKNATKHYDITMAKRTRNLTKEMEDCIILLRFLVIRVNYYLGCLRSAYFPSNGSS